MILFFFRHRPHHAGKFHLVADDRRGAQQLLHDITQRLLAIAELLSAIDAVNLRDVGELGISVKDKITKEALIERDRRGLAEQFTQRG